MVNPAQIFLIALTFLGCEAPLAPLDNCAIVRRAPKNLRAIEISTEGKLSEHGACPSGNCRWRLKDAVLRRTDKALTLERPGHPTKRFPYLEAPFVRSHDLALIRAGATDWILLNAVDWSERKLRFEQRKHELFGLAFNEVGEVLLTGRLHFSPLRQGRVSETGDVLFSSDVLLRGGAVVRTTGSPSVLWPDGTHESLGLDFDVMYANPLGDDSVVVVDLQGQIFIKTRGVKPTRLRLEKNERAHLNKNLSFVRSGARLDLLRGVQRSPWRNAQHAVDGTPLPTGARRLSVRLLSNALYDGAMIVERIETKTCATRTRVYRARAEQVRLLAEFNGRLMRPVVDEHGVIRAVLGDDFSSL